MGPTNDRFGHLVTPGIETGEVDVPVRKKDIRLPFLDLLGCTNNIPYLLILFAFVEDFRCVGSTTIESMSWFQRIHHIVILEVLFHVFIVFQFFLHVALPHFDNMEATIFKVLDLFHGDLMEIMHGLFADLVDGVPCITFQTPCKKKYFVKVLYLCKKTDHLKKLTVPETAMEFIRRMCFLIIAIQGISTNSLLSTIPLMLNVHIILLGRVR